MDSQQSLGIDIRSKQDQLMNKFSQLTRNESVEMSIDLFYLLKASNVPMTLFDRIMS